MNEEPSLPTDDQTQSYQPDPLGTKSYSQPMGETGQLVGGKYKLLDVIGEGGMGRVWRAQQSEPVKRLVAVKLIKAGMDSKAVIARFEAERQALAVMDHPNIAKILDGGLYENRPYFVMELVKGVPITEYCDARKLTPKERLELFVPVCQAIQHAHQKGIIHRDIKPSNVMVAQYDDKPVVKVIDFGVAKATGGAMADRTLDTGVGGIVGTPQYMSPEQASLNNLDIDTRSDVYSLGVLLYELLTGSPPFSGKELRQLGLLEILRVVREVEPPKPSTKLSTADALPTLSANRGMEPKKLTGILRNELDWIVLKALEKDRSRRYETANGFAADVQRYLSGEAVLAHPPSAGYRFRKFLRRHSGSVIAAGLVFVTLVAGLIGTGLGLAEAKRQASRADQENNDKLQALEREDAERSNRIKTEYAAIIQTSLQLGKMEETIKAFDQAETAGVQLTAEMKLDRLRALSIVAKRDRFQSELNKIDVTDLPPALRGRYKVMKATNLWGDNDRRAMELLEEAKVDGLPDAENAYVQGLQSSNSNEAVEHFQRAIKLDWLHFPARANACYLLFLLGRLDDAISLCEQSIGVMPQQVNFQVILALSLGWKGDESKALKALSSTPEPLGSQLRAVVPVLAVAPIVLKSALGQGALDFQSSFKLTRFLLSNPQLPKMVGSDQERLQLTSVFGSFPPQHREIMDIYIEMNVACMNNSRMPFLKFLDKQEIREKLERTVKRHPEGFLATLLAVSLCSDKRDNETVNDYLERLRTKVGYRTLATAFQQASTFPSFVNLNEASCDFAILFFTLHANDGEKYTKIECDPFIPLPPVNDKYRTAVDAIMNRISRFGMPPESTCDVAVKAAAAGRRFGLARDIVDHWEKLAPKSANMFQHRAWIDYLSEAYPTALRSAESGLKIDPKNEVLIRLKAKCTELLKSQVTTTQK